MFGYGFSHFPFAFFLFHCLLFMLCFSALTQSVFIWLKFKTPIVGIVIQDLDIGLNCFIVLSRFMRFDSFGLIQNKKLATVNCN